jgi:hypothetical protein
MTLSRPQYIVTIAPAAVGYKRWFASQPLSQR